MKHKHYECIVAWAEGKKIQFRDSHDNTWKDVTASVPPWNIKTEYRVGPNTKKFRVALYKDGAHTWTVHCIDEERINNIESNPYFYKWITDWIEYEA